MERKEDKDKIESSLIKSAQNVSSLADYMRQEKQFIQGITLGLFYGIVGNMLVSHHYGLFERLETREFDNLFWSNLLILSITTILILIVTRIYYKRYKFFKDQEIKLTKMIIEVLEPIVENKIKKLGLE